MPEGALFNDPRIVFGAVTYFEETTDRDHNRTLDGEQRMTRSFVAYTSDPLVGSTTVVAFDQRIYPFPPGNPGSEWNGNPNRRVPQPGDKYVELDTNWQVVHTNDNVVCVDVRAQADGEDPQKWEITAQYAGLSDPLAQPPDVDWDAVPYQEHILEEVEAADGQVSPRPILNAAGDPFAEGVMADKDRVTLTIVRNVLTWKQKDWVKYHNSTNATTFRGNEEPPGYPPGTAKVKLSAKRVRRSSNADFYWRVKAVVEINEDGWDARVRNSGYTCFNDPPWGPDRPKKKITCAMHPRWVGGTAPAGQQMLNPDGTLADPTLAVPPPLVFRRYKRKDWGPLGFILNF